MKEKLFMLWLGLTIGNFIWVLLTTREWLIAFERSYFQAAALITAYIVALS